MGRVHIEGYSEDIMYLFLFSTLYTFMYWGKGSTVGWYKVLRFLYL